MNMFKSDMTLFESSVRPLRNISDELDAALDEPDQFSIQYQPIIESKSKKVELAEAFLRWTSPVLGEVSPGRFISVAEQNGLIRRLTGTVLRKVCQNISDLGDLIVSVNISRTDIVDPNFPEKVSLILSAYGVSPQRVILECTDSITPEMAAQAKQTLRVLRDLGHSVAIYELESGFTSFGFIEMHGFTLMKVDKVLIDEALQNATSRRNLCEVVRDCKDKGVKSLAFGIETAEQSALVQKMGFDFQQGYFHSQPLPIDEFVLFAGLGAAHPALMGA